jgi:peptidyl-prolyl cis-trans isomerase C
MLKYSTLLAGASALALLALPLAAQETTTEETAETAAEPAVEMIPNEDLTPETVIATVNGTEITLGQLIIARNQLPPQYQQLPDEVLFAGVIDQLVQQQLFADMLEADPARVTIALENTRRSLLAGEVINSLIEDAVTEEAIAAAYEEQFGNAPPVTEWNASHILVATAEEAQAVIDRLNAGEDFADLARELSTDPGSGTNGGQLGWFGPGAMVAPFEEAVASLAAGEISGIVETQFGFHVLTVNETREQTPPALEEVAGEIAQQIQQTAIEATLAELTEAAEIELPQDGLYDPTILRNLDLLEGQ